MARAILRPSRCGLSRAASGTVRCVGWLACQPYNKIVLPFGSYRYLRSCAFLGSSNCSSDLELRFAVLSRLMTTEARHVVAVNEPMRPVNARHAEGQSTELTCFILFLELTEEGSSRKGAPGQQDELLCDSPAAVAGLLMLQHTVDAPQSSAHVRAKQAEADSQSTAGIDATEAAVGGASPDGAFQKASKQRLSKLYRSIQDSPLGQQTDVNKASKQDGLSKAADRTAGTIEVGLEGETRPRVGDEDHGPAEKGTENTESHCCTTEQVDGGNDDAAESKQSAKAGALVPGFYPVKRQRLDAVHEAVQGKGTGGLESGTRAGRGRNFYRGVYKYKHMAAPYSVIKFQGKQCFLGCYKTCEMAAHAWDVASLKRTIEMGKSLSSAKLNFPLEYYMASEGLMTTLVQSSFDTVMRRLRTASDTGRANGMEDFMKFKEEPGFGGDKTPRQEREEVNQQELAGPVENMARSWPMPFIEDMADAGDGHGACEGVEGGRNSEEQDAISELYTRPVKQLRTLHTGSRAAQNSWIKRIRDDQKFKGVYFSRDGVPYSKVELEGKYHYLGRFETMEEAARAYDLATLKRAMLHNQNTISLNFPMEHYTEDAELMQFLKTADCDEVARFVRSLAGNKRATRPDPSPKTVQKRRMMHPTDRLTPTPRKRPFENLQLGQAAGEDDLEEVEDDLQCGVEKLPGLSDSATEADECKAAGGSRGVKEDGDMGPAQVASVAQLEGTITESKQETRQVGEHAREEVATYSSAPQMPAVHKRVCDRKLASQLAGKGSWVQLSKMVFGVHITEECASNFDSINTLPGKTVNWEYHFANNKSQ